MDFIQCYITKLNNYLAPEKNKFSDTEKEKFEPIYFLKTKKYFLHPKSSRFINWM